VFPCSSELLVFSNPLHNIRHIPAAPKQFRGPREVAAILFQTEFLNPNKFSGVPVQPKFSVGRFFFREEEGGKYHRPTHTHTHTHPHSHKNSLNQTKVVVESFFLIRGTFIKLRNLNCIPVFCTDIRCQKKGCILHSVLTPSPLGHPPRACSRQSRKRTTATGKSGTTRCDPDPPPSKQSKPSICPNNSVFGFDGMVNH